MDHLRDLVLAVVLGATFSRACTDSTRADVAERDLSRVERRLDDIGQRCAEQIGRLDRRVDAADRIERELQRVRADVQRIAGAL